MRNRAAFLQRDGVLYLFVACVSVLLSFYINSHETLINPDAICYLLSAQALETVGIRDAMHLCDQAKWPFYSALIYGMVQLTHLSYTMIAYLLDGVFSLLSVSMFVLIVKECVVRVEPSRQRILWLAAAVILSAHEFNSVREYIIRDHGYWAFYLASLLFLLRYFRQSTSVNALMFSASLIIATLFRIEGAIFLLALPWLTWFYSGKPWRQRLKCFITLNLPLCVLSVVTGIWMFLHPQITLNQLGRVQEIINQFLHGMATITQHYQAMQSALTRQVLTSESARNAGLILSLVMLVWYILSVIGNLSWIYTGLVIYAWRKKAATFSSNALLVLYGYLGVNVVVTFLFLLEHQFLAKRYLMALSLVLMLWVPFALNQLVAQATQTRQKIIVYMIGLFIFLSALGGIFDFGYSKTYLRTAGDWLTNNVPADARLYTNDIQVMYYSHHVGDRIFVNFPAYASLNTLAYKHWQQYDYLALRLNKKQDGETAALLQEIKQAPIQVFTNSRGDRVEIYRISNVPKMADKIGEIK